MWFLSYSTEENFSGQLRSDYLQELVDIYNPDESPLIKSNNRHDSICGLAYAQAENDPWTLALFRQTAMGRLGEWFGKDLRRLDKHVREVGIPYFAREEYRSLSKEDKNDLDIFTGCINEAMKSPKMAGRDEFVLLKLEPNEWEPWDSIAIYRLLSWLSAEVRIDPSINIEHPSLFGFIEEKRAVATWLLFSGQEHNYSFVVPKGDKSHLGARLVYGSASESPLVPITLIEKRKHRRALCYKGTLVCPIVTKESGTAIMLPNAELRIQERRIRASANDRWPITELDKIVYRDGEEELVERRLMDRQLFLEEKPDPADFPIDTVFVYGYQETNFPRDTTLVLMDTVSANVVVSPIFSSRSDQSKWLSFLLDDDLVTGHSTIMASGGVYSGSSGSSRDWGPSEMKLRLRRGWFRANSSKATLLTKKLESVVDNDSLLAADWYLDSSSNWANELRTKLLPFLRKAEDSADESISLSAKYVNNWDGNFTKDNIGASIFSEWMSVFKQDKGEWPIFPPASDSLRFPPSDEELEETLSRSFASLQSNLGPNTDQWMWNRAQPGSLFKAVWASDLLSQDLPKSGTTKAFPIQNSHGGHFSTLRWQASGDDRINTAAWYFSGSNDFRDEAVYFNDAHEARNLFGRLSSSYDPQEYRLGLAEPVAKHRIQIVPKITAN